MANAAYVDGNDQGLTGPFHFYILNRRVFIMEKKNLNCQVKGCNGKLITVIFAGKVRCECDTCGTIIYQTDRAYVEED